MDKLILKPYHQLIFVSLAFLLHLRALFSEAQTKVFFLILYLSGLTVIFLFIFIFIQYLLDFLGFIQYMLSLLICGIEL